MHLACPPLARGLLPEQAVYDSTLICILVFESGSMFPTYHHQGQGHSGDLTDTLYLVEEFPSISPLLNIFKTLNGGTFLPLK